jgi:NADH-quinone oxidoreductase subunit D
LQQPDTTVIKSALGRSGIELAVEDVANVGIVCRVAASDARATVVALRDSDLAFDFLIDVFGIDTGEAIDVVYRMRSFARDEEVTIKAAHEYDSALRSVWDVFPAALMPERELAELFGLTLDGHPNPRRLLTTDGCAPYLRKSVAVRGAEEVRNRDTQVLDPADLERTAGRIVVPADAEADVAGEPPEAPQEAPQAEFPVKLPAGLKRVPTSVDVRRAEHLLLNMGPQHPSTHGVLRVVLKLDGEKVVDLDPVLGYLHRGVEKLCENADYHQAIAYLDPLEYVSSLFCEWPAVIAFEKLLDVEVPRRAEYIRVLSTELNRIASHALFLGWMALDLGGLTPILWSFIERDEIVDMLAALTGQRMLFNYFRIGGVNGDLNHEFMSRLGDWMSKATEQIESGNALLNENEIFVRRMRGLGTIDTATALRMVMTGPNLRATGVPFDIRRAHPYSVFPELEFDIPTRSEGDCLARYLLRMDEIKQSLRIIDQCLHNMPDGPVMAKLPRLLRPRPGRAYAAVEGPRGQYSTYAISDGTDQPFRMRIHDPSFIHLQSVGLMMPGNLVADTMAVMASLDPIMGGVDK